MSDEGGRAKVKCVDVNLGAEGSKNAYAISDDYRRLFAEEAQSLHLLSLLLTADPEKTAQCIVSGLDECMDSNTVFQEWARSWVRRIIIRNAIRMISPHPGSSRSDVSLRDSSGERNHSRIVLQNSRFAGVLALEDFERFVYVLSVLEGYPDREIAVLMVISTREVQEARLRALLRIGECSW
jgi:hypothetical protein